MSALTFIFSTGVRIGSLGAADHQNLDEQRLGLSTKDISFTKMDQGWAMAIKISHLKGLNDPLSRTSLDPILLPVERSENVLIEATWLFLILLLSRGRLAEEGGAILGSLEALLNSKAARFVGIRREPVFINTVIQDSEEKTLAATAHNLITRLACITDRVGLPTASFHLFRRDFATELSTMLGERATMSYYISWATGSTAGRAWHNAGMLEALQPLPTPRCGPESCKRTMSRQHHDSLVEIAAQLNDPVSSAVIVLLQKVTQTAESKLNVRLPVNGDGIATLWWEGATTSQLASLAKKVWARALAECDCIVIILVGCQGPRCWWVVIIVWIRHYAQYGCTDPLSGLAMVWTGAVNRAMRPTLCAHTIHRRPFSTNETT